jgi:hypothetical protein
VNNVYNEVPVRRPSVCFNSGEVAAMMIGFGSLGAVFLVGYYLGILAIIIQFVIPTLPKTDLSYGQEVIIDLPLSAFLGFLVGSTCTLNFYVSRILTLIPPLLIIALVLYLQIENWRHFGFGRDNTIEAFSHFPGVIVSTTAILILATVLGYTASSSRKNHE